MPKGRRKIDVRGLIQKVLSEEGRLTWSELIEKTGVSKGALSKHLNKDYMNKIIDRSVDTTEIPPRVYYSIKKLENADERRMPIEPPNDILSQTITDSEQYKKNLEKYEKELDQEMKVYEKFGIVELEDPEKALRNVYLFSYQDFVFTLFNAAKAPHMLESLMLMNRHVDINRRILWQLVVRFVKDPEWNKRLEKVWEKQRKRIEKIRKQIKADGTHEYLK